MGVFMLCVVLGSNPGLVVQAPSSQTCLVELRDGAGRIEGRLNREDAEGIEVAAGGTNPARRIRWDQIRVLKAEPAPATRARRMTCGEWLWRGRARLARSDAAAAREAFKQATALIEPEAVVLAMLAAEGRARAGALSPVRWSDSVGSALAASQLRTRRKPADPWFEGADPVDGASGLILSLPPAWIGSAFARRAASSMQAAADEARRRGDPEMAGLLEIGAAIAAADAAPAGGTTSAVPPSPKPGASSQNKPSALPGARLLALWAESVSPDPAVRAKARDAIRTMPQAGTRAIRAWAIYAEARSLTMETDPKIIRLGAGKLLLIPAAYALDCPALVDAALFQAAQALERLRDPESAAALRSRMSVVPEDMESEQGENS